MQNISSTEDLKEAIRLLEIEKTTKGQLLREQFRQTYESLKPFNILRSTLKDIISSSSLVNTLFSTTAGLATGYLSKKIVVGSSTNLFRKLFGTIIQIRVANTVARNPDAIKSIGQFILQYILSKKETNPK